MIIKKFEVGIYRTNNYLLIDEETKLAVLIDASGEFDKVNYELKKANAKLQKVLLTHGHFDHILGLDEVLQKSSATVFINEKDLPIIEKLDNIAAEIDEFKTVDEDLKDIRAKISELDQEFAMETAKRKREARKMVEGDDGEVSYEENYQLSAKLDNLAEQATAATEIEDEEPEEKLSDKIWFIILTGIFVIGVIAAMVHILPFSEGVRKLFIVCTFLFVIVTIVEGLYAKGVFQDDITTPSEEEFKRIIKELEKQAETSEDDVEIDMTFAKEYAEKKADLKVIEKNHLDRRAKKLELEEEFTVISKQRDAVEREVHAINLAINTINEMSAQIHGDLGFLINDNISDIVSKITDGKYDDVRLDENLHVMVRDGDSYVGIEYLSAGTMEQIYLAVRLSVARLLCRDKMPLIIDDIFTNYDEPRLINTLDCLKTIDTEQIILMTSNPHIGDMLDDLDMDYNYVELA